ncbi:MAG: ABC transporter permease [Methylobacteriaceae bacterium]|nr:ABC transporter permease [Methylobacteriaceae bacterium]
MNAPTETSLVSSTALPERNAPRTEFVRAVDWEKYFASVFSIGSLLLGWEILSRWVLPIVNPRAVVLMPPPSLVFAAGWETLKSGLLFSNIVASTQRVLLAWGATCAVAIPLGISMGWWSRFNRYANPIVELLRPIPPLAWIPISILWFGIGLQQNVFIIMIGCFFPVLLNTIHGVRGVDPVLIRAARNFCMSEYMVLRRVILPASLPSIFTGARIGLGVAWMVLVAAELVAATSGLGFMIEDARNFLRTDVIFVGMITIGCMGILMEGILRILQNRMLGWYHG